MVRTILRIMHNELYIQGVPQVADYIVVMLMLTIYGNSTDA